MRQAGLVDEVLPVGQSVINGSRLLSSMAVDDRPCFVSDRLPVEEEQRAEVHGGGHGLWTLVRNRRCDCVKQCR